MQDSLKTCRYAVAIVSRAFLSQPHPRAELAYAYDKMMWTRRRHNWQCLLVVLFDMRVSDYKRAYREDQRLARHQPRQMAALPPLLPNVDVVSMVTEDGARLSWSQACFEIYKRMMNFDAQGAIQAWKQVVHLLNTQRDLENFPHPNGLYVNET